MVVVLPPSEYQGNSNTAAGGRVVLRHKLTLSPSETKDSKGKDNGNGKGKGKETKDNDNVKCELQLLGGKDMTEILSSKLGLAASLRCTT